MPKYYEFEVSLQEIQPRSWRRFLLRTTSTFAQLHQAIQQSFGWQESYLWEFRLPPIRASPSRGCLVATSTNARRRTRTPSSSAPTSPAAGSWSGASISTTSATTGLTT